MEKITNSSQDDIAEVNNFDKDWKSRFEQLGKEEIPVYQKASYSTKISFERRESFLKHLIDILREKSVSISSESSCLDIGCNTGYYTKILHERKFIVYGIDYAESLLHEAKKNYPYIPFYQASAYDLPFKDNSFDFIVSFGVIQCVADWQKALKETHRVLRPGGIAMVETNRTFRFSYLEKFTRNMGHWIRGEISFKDVIKKIILLRQVIKKTKPSPRLSSLTYAPIKHPIKNIIRFLVKQNVSEITIHDPAKYWLFHNIFWGFSFVKNKSEKNDLFSNKIINCPLCFRSRKWKVKS